MTISTAPTPLSYAGNGSTTSFPVTWKYNAKAHVVATLRSSAGVETVWALTTNYTLTDPGDTGTLTAVVAPATGETLVITLEPPNTQSSDIPLGGDFPSTMVEDGLDLSAQRDGKIESLFLRALRVPKTDTQTGSLLELPIDSLRASKFLGFDASGKPIASVGTSDGLGPVTAFINTLLDDTTEAAARETLGAAPLASPALTGTPTVPTAAAGTNTTQAASTAFVGAAIVATFSTGDVKITLKNTADSGFVMMNDGTIGNAASGATTRANADTAALFTLLWNNIVDQWCPVFDSAGAKVARGASAAADFAANCRLRLSRTLGRAIAVAGLGTWAEIFTADVGTDVLTVPINKSLYTGATVQVSNSGGALPNGDGGGLAAATNYYWIRLSDTTGKISTSLANAHAGTAIDITSVGTGTHTITMSLTTRALGEHVGEEAHSTALAENGPHSHQLKIVDSSSGATTSMVTSATSTTLATRDSIGDSGSGTPHNTMQPSAFINLMIKL